MAAPGRRERTGPAALPESATLRIHVVPRSSKEGVVGLSEGAVKVRLTAPPVENRANEALVAFLAGALAVPRRRVELVAGEKGRRKLVRIHGLARGEVYRRLGLQEPPD